MRLHTPLGHNDQTYTIMVRSSLDIQSRVDFGQGVRSKIGDVLKQVNVGTNVLLLCQNSLPKEWLAIVHQSLEMQGFKVRLHILPDGEEAKDLSVLSDCWQLMQAEEFTRNDSIVAIGGGAISDIAGFCASTYLRGINLFLVPTTLLAQVDASIGGKTGINLNAGKNLAGTFYFPRSVIVDPEFLTTLPARELKSGMGEIVKYAYIEETIAEATDYKRGPRALHKSLAENFKNGISADNPALGPLISCCVRMKLAVVIKDPHEKGLRRCLNLGHTLGHAIEKVSKFSVSHGESVSIGTVFAFKLANKIGIVSEQQVADVELLNQLLDLPSTIPPDLDRDQLIKAVAFDKKRQGDAIKFVLPEKSLGKVSLDFSITANELSKFLTHI